MERYSHEVGPKQSVAIIAVCLALGMTAFILLLDTVSAGSKQITLEELSEHYWPKESASLSFAPNTTNGMPRLGGLTLGVSGATATATVPLLTQLTAGVSGSLPIDVLDVTGGDLGAYQFRIEYDDTVVEAVSVSGGDSPFGGITASNITTAVTGGAVAWNSFQSGSEAVTAAITVANVVFEGVGTAGDCSVIDIIVEELVDNDALPIINTDQDGQICLTGAPTTAETDLVATQDSDDGNLPTGVKPTIGLVKDSETGDPLPESKIASYEAIITFPASLAVATDCRLKAPFDGGVTDCSIIPGSTHLQGTSTVTGSGTAAPIDPLAYVALRLTGSNDSVTGLTTVDLNFVSIIDEFGGSVEQESPPDTRTFLRGDALANGNISISDALFIGQHLVAPFFRPVGEGGGEVNPVNAGSVSHDSPNDVISLADAILIAQFLVGNVDEFYDPIP